jgi:RHS repeat-associated protein
MKIFSCLSLLLFLILISAPEAKAFHAPPWDTGHNSFQGDPGENDNDPGDDACPANTCCLSTRGASPVEFATGNFIYSLPILSIPSFGPALELTLTYNSRDNRKSMFGHGWVHPFDQHLIETTDEVDMFAICSKSNGKRERFKRNPDGSYTPPPYIFDSLSKNTDETFILRDPKGLIKQFTREGQLRAVVDRNGNTLTFDYDPTGFMSRITDASGRSINLVKGADGKVESFTDPGGRSSRLAYDSSGNLIRYTNPLGNTTVYQYDAKNNLTTVRDPRGNILMQLTYDNQGRVATHTDLADTWTYNYFTNRTTKRDAQGNTWAFDYNNDGNVTKRTDPSGSTEFYVYDANLNVTQFTDKNGNKTTTTYDAIGNPLTITDALNNVWRMAYEPAFLKLTSVTDPRGNVSRLEYDSKGNIIKIINALGHVTEFRNDARGKITKVSDSLGQVSNLTYDNYGNLTRSTDPLGNSISIASDVLGKVVSITDALGRISQFTYDDADQLVGANNALGNITSYEYDIAGNLTGVTTSGGARTSFEYDSLNRLARKTNPLNQSTRYTYNLKSKLASMTDPKGQTITYTYDSLDRMVRKVKPDDTVNYIYDRIGNLLTAQDSDSSIAFVYDALKRVIEARTAQMAGQRATTIRFSFDASGNRQTMSDPAGGVTNYSYDVLSRLTSLTNPLSETFSFTYDSLSRRTMVIRPGGLITTYTYDAANRMLSLVHQGGPTNLSIDYTYDPPGNRKSRTDADGSHLYTYDPLNRLTNGDHTAGQPVEFFAYDIIGNRTASHLSSTYTYNSANRLIADASFDYTYDANGNLIRKSERATNRSTTYNYNSENQLTRIDFPDATFASYRYDSLGRRIEKNVNGQTTQYIYDRENILFEYAGDTLIARYTHGPGIDEVISVQRGGTSAFFLTDALGSITRLIDSTSIKSSVVYDSFGRIITQTGTQQEPYGFQGREFDRESGLYYFRARYYDPLVGRYISEDPIGLKGGDNLYSFVRNNPVTLTDPSGLYPGEDIIEFIPDAIGADIDFLRNYFNLREANTIGADKYFHCKANCEASRRGPGGSLESWLISESRELWDQYIKGYPASDCNSDRRANNQGRQNGSNNRNTDCSQSCSGFRPRGLDPKY